MPPLPQPTLLTAPTSTALTALTAPLAPTLTVNQIQTVLLAAARMLHGRLDGDRARREGMQGTIPNGLSSDRTSGSQR
jgi:hypothetical protein